MTSSGSLTGKRPVYRTFSASRSRAHMPFMQPITGLFSASSTSSSRSSRSFSTGSPFTTPSRPSPLSGSCCPRPGLVPLCRKCCLETTTGRRPCWCEKARGGRNCHVWRRRYPSCFLEWPTCLFEDYTLKSVLTKSLLLLLLPQFRAPNSSTTRRSARSLSRASPRSPPLPPARPRPTKRFRIEPASVFQNAGR